MCCSSVAEYQRLAHIRNGTTYAQATEDGEAAVAHHASATGVPRNTHRGELSPNPSCIRPTLSQRRPHLRRRKNSIRSIDTSHADDAPIRQLSRRRTHARVEELGRL
jgi:hypothetical protein